MADSDCFWHAPELAEPQAPVAVTACLLVGLRFEARQAVIVALIANTAARPDIFQLHVDERPKRPVTTHTGDTASEEKPSAQRSRHAFPGARK